MRKLFTTVAAAGLLAALCGPRLAEASYGFLPQITGDGSTAGPNSTVLTVTKVNGVAPGTAFSQNTGTSGATIPLLNGANTWGATQAFAAATATSVTSSGALTGQTLTNTGAIIKNIRKITSGASYSAVLSDNIIDVVKTTGSATAITLPASPTDGMEVEIKDKKGDAATNNITVSAASGNIDGQANIVLGTAYANGVFRYDSVAGTWSLY